MNNKLVLGIVGIVVLVSLIVVFVRLNGSLPSINHTLPVPSDATTSKWSVYRNDELGFQVKYPEQWVALPRTEPQLNTLGETVLFSAQNKSRLNSADVLSPSLMIVSIKLPSVSPPLASIHDQVERDRFGLDQGLVVLKEKYGKDEVGKSQEFVVGGRLIYSIGFAGNYGSGALAIVKDGNVIVINIDALEASAEHRNYANLVESIASTIGFLR